MFVVLHLLLILLSAGFPALRLYRNTIHSSARERRAGLVLPPVFSIASVKRLQTQETLALVLTFHQLNRRTWLNSYVPSLHGSSTDLMAPFACICHNVVESYTRPFRRPSHTHFTTSFLGRTLSHSLLVTHVTLHAVGKSLNEKQKKVFI